MEDRTVRNERRRAGRDIPTKLDDLLYDAFYSAAIGGSVLGLFFLLVDVVAGQPFYTPTLMGSVMFLGMSPEAVTEVRLELVAYFTMLHIGAFGALGLALSILVYEVELHSAHPARAVAVLFLVIEGGFLISANVFMPGVVAAIGFGQILVGNLLTATAMVLFMLMSHNPKAWDRLLHGNRERNDRRSQNDVRHEHGEVQLQMVQHEVDGDAAHGNIEPER